MTEPDPDQLLKFMDAQLAVAKSRRNATPVGNRDAFRIASIVIFVVVSILAICVLDYMMPESHPPRPAPQAQVPPDQTH